jgi:hypothetical protein
MKIINFFLITLFFVLNIATSQDGNTPTNLTIDAASVGGVQLSWDTPENFRRNWITHSNSTYLFGIGQVGGGSVFYGQKYPDSLLSEYHGMLVKEIAFVPADTSSFQPLVFEIDPDNLGEVPDWLNYSNLVLSAPLVRYESGFGAWKTAEMKDHVPGNSLSNDIQPSSYIIDSTKSIYIGYVISDYPLYPAGCDNGPALDGLGNLVVWCNNNGCGELTLAEAAADGLTLDYNWMVALSLISSDAPSRTYTLSHYGEIELPDANQSLGYVSSLPNTSVMNHGPRQGLFLDINTLRNRDISNYFLFENGAVADVIQPTYLEFNVITRESSVLGPREPGTYSYYVRAQTADGLSDSSNVVSVDLVNNAPGNFFLIAPEENASISVTPSNLNNPNTFIWSNSVDTDGQDLYYLFKMCKGSDSDFCFDTTMTERIYQPTNQSIIDSFSLGSGEFDFHWSVQVTDGIDTLFAGGEDDSIRYFTFSTTQLGVDHMHLPQEYSLKQNYPNPFNPSTTIKYQIAKSEYVNISIFDLNGTKISSILNQYSRAGKGSVSWNGKNEMGQNVSGGIYLYTIETPSFSKTKKMILLK